MNALDEMQSMCRHRWPLSPKSPEQLPEQALENRTLDSKREMDIMNALDETNPRP